jgi:hypothetical protein
MVFIDLEKAYDKISRDLIWWVLNKRNVPRGYLKMIKDMYEGVVMRLRTTSGETYEFPATIGLH